MVFLWFSYGFSMVFPLIRTRRNGETCLSDEHRVVLGPSAQDADGALQLVVAASVCESLRESFPG